MQKILMKFDPATGKERPYPSHAAQWREWHGGTAWLFDPWTGRRRDARDVGSDVHGLLIVPAGTLGGDTGCGASKQNKHEAGNDAQRPPTPVGWSDTDWIKHLQEQEGQHPLEWLHINQGRLDAAADAYEAEYNAARMLEALKAAAQFVETEQFPIGWSVDRIREVIAKVSGTTPNSACTDTPPDAALAAKGGVMDKCYRCNEVISMCPCDESTYTADDEISRLRAELETERMRLVACSVIALANTPESAASARDMHPDYQSPCCDDVARAVDREIALRAELDSMTASRKAAAAWGELWRVRCARAVDELAVARAELAECKDLLRIASDFVERLPGHEGRTAFTDRIDAAIAAKEE